MRRAALPFALALLIGPLAPAHAATRVDATLSAGSVEAGAGVTLAVVVSDPAGDVADPQVALPPGITLLGSARSTSFSWINGHTNNRVEVRIELGTEHPGHYRIGPISVRVGRAVFSAPAQALEVTSAATRPLATGRSFARVGARLDVEARPLHPYVGQVVQLALRLVQTQDLSLGGPNTTPSTTGFWTESYGDPIQYRANVGGRLAIVNERRVRIYPLGPGRATIGPAAIVVVPESNSIDPFFGGAPARAEELHSDSLHVDVRPLPPGAPAGFANAVGQFTWSWQLDRGHATQDQAVTLSLDVRGTGNLPLLRTPEVALPDFEVFAGAVDDSFAAPGELAMGRRRFQWTLTPRRVGVLSLEPPPFAWFDPASGSYRSVRLEPLTLDVLARSGDVRHDDDASQFPDVFSRDLPRPGGRAARPWLAALGGLLLGLAVRLWRGAGRPDPKSAERAEVLARAKDLELRRGSEFWHAAEQAADWLERAGEPSPERPAITAARYAGRAPEEESVRRSLVQRLQRQAPASAGALPLRALALLAVALGLGSWLIGMPLHGPEALAARARAADALARGGQLPAAAAEWERIWRVAPGDPALAARLVWAAAQAQRPAEAAAWALRGQAGEPRSAALAWAITRVRESGGLVGAPAPPLPLRALEWAALAFALALGAVLEWPRRWTAALLALLALAAALALPMLAWRAASAPLAVVRADTPVVGADMNLDPGEVVHVVGHGIGSVRIRVGHDVAGEVPASALLELGPDGR